ncbi:MAG: hypothetical protein AAFO91_09075 [Bacteroidota bacterium]
MTRTLTGILLLLLSILPLTTSLADDTSSEIGEWGYRYQELHEHGIVDELIERERARTSNNTLSCCEGAHSGECRVTVIDPNNGSPMYKIGDRWCPLRGHVRTDIPLPGDITAVVCASAYIGYSGCPTVYCATANFNS